MNVWADCPHMQITDFGIVVFDGLFDSFLHVLMLLVEKDL